MDTVGQGFQKPRRHDYAAMATMARALLEAGTAPEDVLQACYGVPFPVETFVLAEMMGELREPSALYTNLPWNLLIPLAEGGPPAEPDIMYQDEQRVFALDPDLVPLMVLRGDFYEYSGAMLCYQLDELAAGRSTIMGFRSDLADGSVAKIYGDSLAAVILADRVDTVRRTEEEFASPHNVGAGSVDQAELKEVRAQLACAQELVRRVSERRRPKLIP